jgi:hypothetical protein
MTRRRKTTPLVPLAPRHRRTWRTLWRRCACGLAAPCVDSLILPPIPPFPPPRGLRTERRAEPGDDPIPLWSEASGRSRAQSPDAVSPPHPPGASDSPGGVPLPDSDLEARPTATSGAVTGLSADHRGRRRASATARRGKRDRSPAAPGRPRGESRPGAVDHEPESVHHEEEARRCRLRRDGMSTPPALEGGGTDTRSANRGGRSPRSAGHDRADRVTRFGSDASEIGCPDPGSAGPEPAALPAGRPAMAYHHINLARW